MAEWLRRQIRIGSIICFPLGAQVQILLVSFFLSRHKFATAFLVLEPQRLLRHRASVVCTSRVLAFALCVLIINLRD